MRTKASAHPLLTSHFWMSSPSTSQRATMRPRRSVERVWQVQLLLPACLINSSRAATPQVQRSPLVLRQSWSVDGASMPPRRMRLLPITIWSPSRILGTPVTSAASAADGSARSKTGIAKVLIIQWPTGIDQSMLRLWAEFDPSASALARHALSTSRDSARHHRPPREREPHQHEGRGDLGAADENPRRRLHLVPLIGAVGPMAAAFAK